MHLAYCDDEIIQLEYMEHLTKQWALERGETLHFFAYRSGEELLFEHEDGYPFDLLILDIDMKEMDGMSLAKKIRKTDKNLTILFLTNHKEYVFEGYEVNAFRYILKPIEEDKLYPLLDEILQQGQKDKPYLIEQIAGEKVKLYLEDILFLETNGHYLNIHMNGKIYEVKKSLKEIQKEIAEATPEKKMFVSTHRSFQVNIAQVEQVLRSECIMSDKSSVPISRNSYKEVNQAFITYNRMR